MNKYQKQRLFVFIIICLLVIVVGVVAAKANGNNKTMIRIYNPTQYNISLEFKCNWSNTTKRFEHHKFYTLHGNNNIDIFVPHGHLCQLWPGVK
jgi:hypothetical protein